MRQRNHSIDIVRLICSVMVIAIHTRPFLLMQSYMDGGIQILVRLAVPFFFCTTGYFLKEAVNKSGTSAILRTLKKDFLLYLAWSILYFAVIFLENPALLSFHSAKWMAMDFFVNGSYYHLWYMAAVLWCVLALFALCKLNLEKVLGGGIAVLYLLGLLGTSYSLLGNQMPVLSILFQSPYFTTIRRIWLMGFPFVVLGWMISVKKDRLLSISLRKIVAALLVTFALFVLEILTVVVTGFARSIVMTAFLYPLVALIFILCLRLPMVKYERFGTYCGVMSAIIYFMHPLVILLLDKAGVVGSKPQFLLTTFICILLSGSVVLCRQRWKGRREG